MALNRGGDPWIIKGWGWGKRSPDVRGGATMIRPHPTHPIAIHNNI